MEIRSKREFYELWRAGVLGNRTLIWDTIEEALDYRPKLHKFGFREIGKTGGGAWELAAREAAKGTYLRWKREGRKLIIDGSVPNNHSVLQGEVCRTFKGMESFLCERTDLNISGLPPMRITMSQGLHRHRGYLETKLLIEKYMDPSSRDDLDILFEKYPEAAIEFTCFDINVGVFPHRNCIFWEVRNY